MGYFVPGGRRTITRRSASINRDIGTLCRSNENNEFRLCWFHFYTCVCSHDLLKCDEQCSRCHSADTIGICHPSWPAKGSSSFRWPGSLGCDSSSCIDPNKCHCIQHGLFGTKRLPVEWNFDRFTWAASRSFVGIAN